MVNLMARYRLTDHLSTTLNLNNLLDEKYYAGFSGSYGHYGPPRNLMMNVRYSGLIGRGVEGLGGPGRGRGGQLSREVAAR